LQVKSQPPHCYRRIWKLDKGIDMLSSTSCWLTYLTALLYVIFGFLSVLLYEGAELRRA
jgi:hypothetical protein